MSSITASSPRVAPRPAAATPSPASPPPPPGAPSPKPLLVAGPKAHLGARQRLGLFLDQPKSSWAALGYMVVQISVIITSVLNFFLSTTKRLKGGAGVQHIEIICAIFFTLEAAARTWVATLDLRRLMLRDPYYWLDVLCVIPFYVEIPLGKDDLPVWVKLLQLFRLLRILKLMRHYTGWRVLTLALQNAWRALLVPCFAMFMTVLVLSGALFLAEEASGGSDDGESFEDGFEAMWCIFWIVSTLGFDGYLGSGAPAGRLILALAIMSGLLFTTSARARARTHTHHTHAHIYACLCPCSRCTSLRAPTQRTMLARTNAYARPVRGSAHHDHR